MVVPSSLHNEVLYHLHNCAGHLGVKHTTDTVEMHFYWPGYETDIAQWVLNCQEYQRRNPQAIKPQAPLGTVQAFYMFELLLWDIMRPIPTNEMVINIFLW